MYFSGVENGSSYLFDICYMLCAVCYNIDYIYAILCVLGLTWAEGKDDLEAKKAKTGEKEEKEQEAQDA